MAKVIVERPRVGGGWLRKGRPLRDEDEPWPKFRRDDLHDRTKRLNENLAPLRRYLAAQVGRRWDDVWSEICENLKPKSTVQQHVRDHIPDFVAIKTSVRDGSIWVHDRFSPCLLKDARTRLYVDPVSGILLHNQRYGATRHAWRNRQKARDAAIQARMRVVSRKTQLHLFGDCWWEVTLAAGTPMPPRFNPYVTERWQIGLEPDVVYRAKLSTLPREELYGRSGVYAVAKRQLSKKEMRDLALPRPH